ncbi:MAG TPA: triose-phosphate isomerase, partial [Cellulomonadaceae bacterium]|nr:triose-phosphate isomerase [Cellulomonadaceae bacterium]
MNLTPTEMHGYLRALRPLVSDIAECDLFVLPSFPALWVAREILEGSNVAWGAQDVHEDDAGAHTGDVSAAMLVDLGCTYVEVGHPERRRDHGETDELVAAKVAQILRYAMTPILCVSEPTR